MVRTQIQLTEQQSQALKTLAYARNLSIAELIRQSINNWLLHENEEDSKQAKFERALSLLRRGVLMRVFCDTSAFLAMLDMNDKNHPVATKLWRQSQTQPSSPHPPRSRHKYDRRAPRPIV